MTSEGLPDPTQRFADRVANYVRYRPTYPEEVIKILERETQLSPKSVVADIGSGTGIFTLLFLPLECTIYAVEPNAAMREAAESNTVAHVGYHSVAGTAEKTGLRNGSISHVVSAQAFHWFDIPKARKEFVRILKPGGWVVLVWNVRRLNSTPFLRAYEDLLIEYGTDYQKVRHENIGAEALEGFYCGPHQKKVLPNVQHFDFEGLAGRLLSSSYAPGPGDPRHQPMMETLRRNFDAHAENGTVAFEYDTEVYFGKLAGV